MDSVGVAELDKKDVELRSSPEKLEQDDGKHKLQVVAKDVAGGGQAASIRAIGILPGGLD